MTTKENLKQEAKKDLLKSYIKKGRKLLIIIKSVAPSGTSRRIKVFSNDCDITDIIADLCELKNNDKGLLITGCGMDMTFWLANDITNRLWGNQCADNNTRPDWLAGNNGGCLDWMAV